MRDPTRIQPVPVVLAILLALALLFPASRGLARAWQQATSTPTPSSTPTATVTPTGTLTVSPTGSVTPGTGTPSLTPTTGTPGASVSPSASPTLTRPAATSTIPFLPAATRSPTPTVTLPATQPPVLVTPQATDTSTPTLIPLPAITFQYPQRTPTGVLLARQDAGDPTALPKGGGNALRSFGRRVARFTPLLLVAALWLALAVWFLASQWWVHRK